MRSEELEEIVCVVCEHKQICKSHCSAFLYIIQKSLQVEGSMTDW